MILPLLAKKHAQLHNIQYKIFFKFFKPETANNNYSKQNNK